MTVYVQKTIYDLEEIYINAGHKGILVAIKGTITVDKMKTLLSDIQTKSTATDRSNSLALAAKAPANGLGTLGDFMQV